MRFDADDVPIFKTEHIVLGLQQYLTEWIP
jgi:hypothetical protein